MSQPAPSGARSISVGGSITNSVVITGDHNDVAVLHWHGTTAQVAAPQSPDEAAAALFLPERPVVASRPLTWLRPDAGVLPIRERPEFGELAQWCRDDQETIVRLVAGPGGQGKTLLGQQVCARLRGEGWLAGFVELPDPRWRAVDSASVAIGSAGRQLDRWARMLAAVVALAEFKTRALLVVDYAENYPTQVAELLDAIAHLPSIDGRPAARLLLLARDEGSWWSDLSVDHPLHHWVDPEPVRLASLTAELGSQQTASVWTEAALCFARAVQAGGWGDPNHPIDLVRLVADPPDGFTSTLDLYADALLRTIEAAHPGGEGAGPARGRDALGELVRHERRYVHQALAGAGIRLDEPARHLALALVTLRQPEGIQEATRFVSEVPPLTERVTAGTLALALARFYPADGPQRQLWQAPRPDRLADTHLLEMAQRAISDDAWLSEATPLCMTEDPAVAEHTARVLLRCLSTPDAGKRRPLGLPRVHALLEQLIRLHPRGYVPPLAILAPLRFQDTLLAAIHPAEHSPAQAALRVEDLRALDERLRATGITAHRVRIAEAVARRLNAASRSALDTAGLSRADELANFADVLANSGRHAESVTRAQEALDVYRRFAEQDVAYIPRYAEQARKISATLRELGRFEDAIDLAEHAADLFRRLSNVDRERYEPRLAVAQAALGSALSEAGRHSEAVQAIQEGVGIYRRLAAADPHTYLPQIGFLLAKLEAAYARASRFADAVGPATEAVAIARTLIQTDPEAYQPLLAGTLTNFGAALTATERFDEAVPILEEAVGLMRPLALANPREFRPRLATALNNLADPYRRAGRHDEAIAVMSEAIAVQRRHATETTFDGDIAMLAMMLSNLGARLVEIGRARDSLAPVEEAVAIRRKLAADRPGEQLRWLAGSLTVLGSTLWELGRVDESLDASAEAVWAWQRLAADRPIDFGELYLQALSRYATQLASAGRFAEATPITEQIVAILRPLAGREPGKYSAHLKGHLQNLRRLYADFGRGAEVAQVTDELSTFD